MNCDYCGTQVPEGASNCPNCGAPVGRGRPGKRQSPRPDPASAPIYQFPEDKAFQEHPFEPVGYAQPKPKKKHHFFRNFLITLLVLAALFLGACFLLGDEEETAEPTGYTEVLEPENGSGSAQDLGGKVGDLLNRD